MKLELNLNYYEDTKECEVILSTEKNLFGEVITRNQYEQLRKKFDWRITHLELPKTLIATIFQI